MTKASGVSESRESRSLGSLGVLGVSGVSESQTVNCTIAKRPRHMDLIRTKKTAPRGSVKDEKDRATWCESGADGSP